MPSNILKLTDYDQDTAVFESFNSRIHIMTINEELLDGVTVSIDIPAARKLSQWLQDTIGPQSYYSNPTLIEEED